MSNITLSMIVKNEEQYLPECLESVKNVVDEIIIIDTGSQDNTRQIAENYGAKIYDFKWTGSFSDARNFGLKHSKANWILYLDADERLEKDSIYHLKDAIRTAKNKVAGFRCVVWGVHVQSDGTKLVTSNRYPRLFRNYCYPKIQFEGIIHEQIAPSFFRMGKIMEDKNIRIKHVGYDITTEELERKVIRNYQPLMKQLEIEPLNSFAWYNLGTTLTQMQLHEQADVCYKQCLKTGIAPAHVNARTSALLAMSEGRKGNYKSALMYANLSVNFVPEQIYGYYVKANALAKMGDYKSALEQYDKVEKAMQKSNYHDIAFDIVIPTETLKKEIDFCKNKMLIT